MFVHKEPAKLIPYDITGFDLRGEEAELFYLCLKYNHVEKLSDSQINRLKEILGKEKMHLGWSLFFQNKEGESAPEEVSWDLLKRWSHMYSQALGRQLFEYLTGYDAKLKENRNKKLAEDFYKYA